MIGWGALCVCLPLKRSSGRRGVEGGREGGVVVGSNPLLEWYAEKTGELGEKRKEKIRLRMQNRASGNNLSPLGQHS